MNETKQHNSSLLTKKKTRDRKTYNKERDKVKKRIVPSFLSVHPNRSLHHSILPHKNNRITT